MNSVIRKYVEEKKELEQILNNTSIEIYEEPNIYIEKAKEKIKEIDEIINKFYSVLTKIWSLKNGDLSPNRINEIKNQINLEKIGLPDDILNYFNEDLEKVTPVVREIGTYEYYLDRKNQLEDKVRQIYQQTPVSMYGRVNIKVDSSIRRELDYITDILKTYDRLKTNIENIRILQDRKDLRDRDDIIRLSNDIKNDKNKLPLKLLEELENYFIHDHIDRNKRVETTKMDFPPDEELDLPRKRKEKANLKVEPVEVVKRRKGKFKAPKGLIIAGISAMAIAVIAALEALAPSISQAMHASDISTLASTMVDNANLWHAVEPAYQATLHGANVEIASNISNLTGHAVSFDGNSGIWNVGNMDLSAFASNAREVAQKAITKVAGISATAAALFTAGVPTLRKGIKRQKENNDIVFEYEEKINDMQDFYKKYTSEDFTPVDYFQIKKLYREISENSKLTNKDKDYLLNTVEDLLDKSKSAVAFEEERGGRSR